MQPGAVVRKWVKHFNNANAEALAELYHDDAINHQMPLEPAVGKDAIRMMFEREFASAEMECQVVQILEDGSWAALEWKDPLGLRGCGFFKVENGLITLQRGYWDRLSFQQLHKNREQ